MGDGGGRTGGADRTDRSSKAAKDGAGGARGAEACRRTGLRGRCGGCAAGGPPAHSTTTGPGFTPAGAEKAPVRERALKPVDSIEVGFDKGCLLRLTKPNVALRKTDTSVPKKSTCLIQRQEANRSPGANVGFARPPNSDPASCAFAGRATKGALYS